ncbi:hypothetical protein QTO34_019489 [Cnephaeus nilssonii]|uniref:Ig-like domain-containing protein n=1 Tax=Cnephaeus nilssonii TaxID=3371016 RepID=A0AA40HWT1_CNENI|nr:hypothetical protein QTO34_019489 [Eptesicus nilssonii]
MAWSLRQHQPPRRVRGMKVEQSPSVLSLQEGTSSTLRCTFSSTMYKVQWFRQNPGGGLITLFHMSSGTSHNGRLSATVNTQDLYSTLNITASRLEDSATYLCAADAQWCQVLRILTLNVDVGLGGTAIMTVGKSSKML